MRALSRRTVLAGALGLAATAALPGGTALAAPPERVTGTAARRPPPRSTSRGPDSSRIGPMVFDDEPGEYSYAALGAYRSADRSRS